MAFFVTCFFGWLCVLSVVAENMRYHDAHAICISVAALLAYCDLAPEILVLHLSSTYFMVDTLDALRNRRWKMLIFHHFPSVALFASQPLFPAMLAGRWASRLLLIEMSTPLLTRWRRSRRKDHFQQFMAVFFCVRVVYLSWQGWVYCQEMGGWPSIALCLLCVVNVYWFVEQSRMLWDYQPAHHSPYEYNRDCAQAVGCIDADQEILSPVTVTRRKSSPGKTSD